MSVCRYFIFGKVAALSGGGLVHMHQPAQRLLDGDGKIVVIEATTQRQCCSNTAQIQVTFLGYQRSRSTSNRVQLLIR